MAARRERGAGVSPAGKPRCDFNGCAVIVDAPIRNHVRNSQRRLARRNTAESAMIAILYLGAIMHRAKLHLGFALAAWTVGAVHCAEPAKYCRFRAGGETAYGVVEGDRVTALAGDLFGERRKTGKSFPLAKVELLVPCRPTQIFAMAGNYRSHLGDQKANPKFAIVQPFLKPTSCLTAPGAPIVLPKDAGEVHYEAEMVVVIGRRAKKVPVEQADDYVFGVTCGNDVSARDWQKNDIQWWRAKGCDTFGPCGPFIVTGLPYDDLAMKLRLNGKVVQDTRTSQLIHSVAKQVSVLSHHVTLEPGDMIFTGTPGETDKLVPGDKVEVELEGVGTLVNRVVADR